LGLVIIDEEHHFGVKQKERAKQLAKNVHLLSMSATPIPRSLQLSLHGIKDLSLIATPPSNRLPIKTWVKYLEPFDLKRAIKNEIARNGQVFLVAPRIDQLPVIKKSLQDIIPDMTITIAHGQMPSDAIDQAMTDFADNKYHGLLSTNIIESGLDLPNVNSIIIFHGDQFGLAQLYQLRGRVGRSHKQSYCFITYPKDKPISHNAKKRLELLDDLHHLGAGFLLASHDLDMRGAGNLLGEEQSGHIKEVGIELYQKMVMHEIANLAIDNKTTSQPDQPNTPADKIKILPDWSPHIVLPLAVALPENYIPDDMVRLSLYKELSESLDEKNLLAIEESLTDRFGAIPIETKNLLTVIELKQLCYQARIAELKISPHSISVMFHDNQVNHPEALFKLLKEKKASLVKETIGNKTIEKIIFRQFANDDKKMIALSKNLLALLININQPSPQ
ncbi:MAG: TRCF domain-containing protein, partial [Alphaproteobacteria bacterium]